jgi:hypothetical protein
MTVRRFPPPRSIEETGACYIVRDRDGQALAYVYYEEEPGRRGAAKVLSKDERGGLLTNVVKLPDFLHRAAKRRQPRSLQPATFVLTGAVANPQAPSRQCS